jgi:hypothetical protein
LLLRTLFINSNQIDRGSKSSDSKDDFNKAIGAKVLIDDVDLS